MSSQKNDHNNHNKNSNIMYNFGGDNRQQHREEKEAPRVTTTAPKFRRAVIRSDRSAMPSNRFGGLTTAKRPPSNYGFPFGKSSATESPSRRQFFFGMAGSKRVCPTEAARTKECNNQNSDVSSSRVSIAAAIANGGGGVDLLKPAKLPMFYLLEPKYSRKYVGISWDTLISRVKQGMIQCNLKMDQVEGTNKVHARTVDQDELVICFWEMKKKKKQTIAVEIQSKVANRGFPVAFLRCVTTFLNYLEKSDENDGDGGDRDPLKTAVATAAVSAESAAGKHPASGAAAAPKKREVGGRPANNPDAGYFQKVEETVQWQEQQQHQNKKRKIQQLPSLQPPPFLHQETTKSLEEVVVPHLLGNDNIDDNTNHQRVTGLEILCMMTDPKRAGIHVAIFTAQILLLGNETNTKLSELSSMVIRLATTAGQENQKEHCVVESIAIQEATSYFALKALVNSIEVVVQFAGMGNTSSNRSDDNDDDNNSNTLSLFLERVKSQFEMNLIDIFVDLVASSGDDFFDSNPHQTQLAVRALTCVCNHARKSGDDNDNGNTNIMSIIRREIIENQDLMRKISKGQNEGLGIRGSGPLQREYGHLWHSILNISGRSDNNNNSKRMLSG